MSEKRKVLRAAGLIGAITLLSRFTGLIRGAVMAAILGDSRYHDVFLTAFAIPNLVRRVLGEGALSAFVVPFFSERRERAGEAAGWHFINNVINFMLLVALVVTLAGMIFSRQAFMLVGGRGLLAHGEYQYFEFGAHLTRIMFPFVLGLTVSAVLMGACHTLRIFSVSSLGSVMLNVAMIAVGGAALVLKLPEARTATWLGWAVLAGAALRIALMVPALRRRGWRWEPVLALRDPHLRRLLLMMAPGLLAMGISQVNIIVAEYFAIYLGRGVRAYIFYANQLVQFPMALTATAAATAMLPQMSQYLLQNRVEELRELMALTKRLEIVLIVPAAVGLMILGLPIIELIMQRRAWGPEASLRTYKALLFYAPGLLPLGWCRLLEPMFYARHDRLTPLKAASISMLVNIGLNWYFAFHTSLSQSGLALANTAAAFINYFILSWWLGRVLERPLGAHPRTGETLWKSALAAGVAGGVGWAVYALLRHWLGVPLNTISRAVYLLPVLALTGALYFALAHALRIPDSDRAMEMVLKKLRKGRRAEPA